MNDDKKQKLFQLVSATNILEDKGKAVILEFMNNPLVPDESRDQLISVFESYENQQTEIKTELVKKFQARFTKYREDINAIANLPQARKDEYIGASMQAEKILCDALLANK